MNAPADVDIIIPVRGAGPAFRRSVASLVRHARPGHDRVIVVLDGPPDAEGAEAVETLRASAIALEVISQPIARGFVVSVNLGFRASTRDVVILNSDTQVTAGWLDKLTAAAYSAADIATVTPFSNNATICSLPRFLAENALPAGYDVDRFGALVESQSARTYPDLPTGVGVCLYIKREVLDAIGPFDEAFGQGYGEEVEFCLRAARAGRRHVLDDATFIFHEGSRSFGASRARRVKRAHARIRERVPEYLAMIADFMRRDPLADARARVTGALVPVRSTTAAPPRRIVHLVHGWPPWSPGGTENYAAWLAREQVATAEVAVYARLADADRGLGDATEYLDHGVRVRLVANNFTARNPFVRHALHSRVLARDFDRFLRETRPHIVHVHHLSGHAASLMRVARRYGARIVYQAQDWWPACARINLWHRDGRVCEGPAPARCSQCLPMTRLPGAAVWNPLLYKIREKWLRSALAGADTYVMGSRFMADTSQAWRLFDPGKSVHILPYGLPIARAVSRIRSPRSPLVIGYLGTLLPHKGVHILIESFQKIDPSLAELHVWGASGDQNYVARLREMSQPLPHVHLHGALAEENKLETIRRFDVLVVPSVGWESFGIVAREAMAVGVPVIASRISALGELFDDGAGGAHVVPGDANALASLINEVAASPERLAEWRARLPRVRTMAEHAAEIDRIYAELMPQRPDTP